MDNLLPDLRLVDPRLPADRQQCLLIASKEAKAHQGRNLFAGPQDHRLRDPETAFDEAKRRCGLERPTEVQYLGPLVLTFGRYTGRTFRRLVENDVGYIEYLLDRHVKESRQPERRATINDEWVKDSLLKYVEFFPSVSCHLEADPRAGSEQDKKMAQEAHTSVKQWLLMKESDITSKSLKRFRQYILDKEKPPQDATPAKATSSSSRSPAAAATTHSSWSDDALDDTLLVDALVTFESQGEPLPISTSQPVSARCPEQLLPSTKERLRLSPPPTTSEKEKRIKLKQAKRIKNENPQLPSLPSSIKKAKRSKKEKPQLPSLPSTSKAASSQRPEQPKHQTPLLSSVPGQTPPDVRPKEPPSTSNSQPVSAATLPQSDSPVELEGWMRPWEESNGIPFADIPWLKEDSERGLFTTVQLYKDIKGVIRRRRVLKSRMWFYPPEPPGFVSGGIPTPHAFFRSRFFFWRPIGVWRCSLKCPRGDKCARPEAKHTSPSLATIAGYVTSATCPVGTPWRQRWFPVGRASSLPGVERVVPLLDGGRGTRSLCGS
ncbi:hypothetical protein UPYG_G00305780 [Umbra pygmaea]|uniref:DUF6729 domain-containing protein n=1 Tax=Umbra pygmaea TaxID=75934 RepID=A0ABD0W354_UMBPY